MADEVRTQTYAYYAAQLRAAADRLEEARPPDVAEFSVRNRVHVVPCPDLPEPCRTTGTACRVVHRALLPGIAHLRVEIEFEEGLSG